MADGQTEIVSTRTIVSEQGINRTIAEWKFTFIAWLFAVCGLFVISNVYTMIPIIGDVSQALHVTTSLTTWSSSIFSIFYAIGFLVFGPLSDLLGRKQVIVYGLLSLALSTFLITFVHSIGPLIVLRAIQGFFAATFQPVALAYVFEIYPSEKRGTTIAIISTGFIMAGIIGQVISSWITKSWGWSFVFVFFGIVYFLVFFILWWFLPTTAKQTEATHLLTSWRKMFRLLLRPKLVAVYIITFTLPFSFVGMNASMGGYLSHTYGLTAEQILNIRSVGIIGMMISPLAGKFIARVGLKSVLVGGLISAAGGLLLESVMPAVHLIALASVIFVAGISISVPTLINVVGVLGDQEKSAAVALYTFILNLGASAGPLILPLGNFTIITLILSGILTVSMIISVTLKITALP